MIRNACRADAVGDDPLLLGHQLVEQQQDGGGGVDRHRGGHVAERDPLEEAPHVVDGVDIKALVVGRPHHDRHQIGAVAV